MDVHSKETRSFNMSRIKGKNTKPEILVRKYLFPRDCVIVSIPKTSWEARYCFAEISYGDIYSWLLLAWS